uniref:Uncharacterized protein n=1 Tax=Panagrolaimus davidi TaxID=227884 RepID=A0A914P6H7_9BILA
MLRFIHVKIPIPKTPSAVIKMKGVDWYLCLEKENVFTFKHQSRIEKNDYLICELTSPDNFQLNPVYQTRVAFFDNI